jgi:hypothetical protein
MPERNAERKIHIRVGEDLHKRLRIRCAELDTTIQDYVVEPLDRELSAGRRPPRTSEPEAGTRRERMTRKARSKTDPIEREIELALNPGAFIPDRAAFSFVSDLDEVAAKIAKLIASDPARAATLYEAFLAAWYLKIEELDDPRQPGTTRMSMAPASVAGVVYLAVVTTGAVDVISTPDRCHRRPDRLLLASAFASGIALLGATPREGCQMSVWSTPRNTENHAKQIRRKVDHCEH